jgi:hypothetical protein
MNPNDFYLRVARALSGCQLVEQELKLYIAEALELVQKCVANRLPFSMSGDDYANASLENLIKIFRKLTSNQALVTELNKFKEERNFLSHKGIAHCLDPDGELCYVTASEFQDRLAAIEPEAQRLRLAIHDEANKFRGHLWFDDGPHAG